MKLFNNVTFRYDDISENYYGFQVYLPHPMFMSAPQYYPNFVVSPSPFYPQYLYNEELKETDAFQVTKLIPNCAESITELTPKPITNFISFSVSIIW